MYIFQNDSVFPPKYELIGWKKTCIIILLIGTIIQKNQDSGSARNNGLKVEKGEYIAFLDPDYWFEPDALEELYTI